MGKICRVELAPQQLGVIQIRIRHTNATPVWVAGKPEWQQAMRCTMVQDTDSVTRRDHQSLVLLRVALELS